MSRRDDSTQTHRRRPPHKMDDIVHYAMHNSNGDARSGQRSAALMVMDGVVMSNCNKLFWQQPVAAPFVETYDAANPTGTLLLSTAFISNWNHVAQKRRQYFTQTGARFLLNGADVLTLPIISSKSRYFSLLNAVYFLTQRPCFTRKHYLL